MTGAPWLDAWLAQGLADLLTIGTQDSATPRTTIDVETRSECDLTETGSWIYSRHHTTEMMVLSYNVGDVPGNTKRIYLPVSCEYAGGVPEPASHLPPPELVQAIHDGHLFEAHNASFEIAIWHNILHERYGWPEIPLRQWRCSMAKAAHAALPMALGMLTTKALDGLGISKDDAGARLMRRMCKPQGKPSKKYPGKWVDGYEERLRLGEYCDVDVESEMAASRAMPDLPWFEWQVWALDMIINLRGAPVDAMSAAGFMAVVAEAKVTTQQRLASLTNGVVQTADEVPKMKAWLASIGVPVDSLAADVVTELLAGDTLPPIARELLEIRQGGALKSVEKCGAILKYADTDGRVRGLFQYHGAATGRWAGRGPQPQNLPKGAFKDHEIDVWPGVVMDTARLSGMAGLSVLGPHPLELVKSSARGLFAAPPGHRLIVSDYRAIEARGLSWLARSEKRLDVFRGHGKIYELNAAGIYGVPLDQILEGSTERTVGKVAELAFGYAGGVGAWMNFGNKLNFSADVEDAEVLRVWNESTKQIDGRWIGEFWADQDVLDVGDARTHYNRFRANQIKEKWRTDNPEIADRDTGLWASYERAAIEAVQTRRSVEAGRVWWFMSGQWLVARLPSGRDLHYFKPWVTDEPTPFGKMKPVLKFWGMKQRPGTTSKTWTVVDTHGGKLTENINQAICRDVMSGNMPAVEAAGYPIALHVHDELVAVRRDGEGSVDEMGDIMCRPLYWSEGLPLAAAGWEGTRYKKD